MTPTRFERAGNARLKTVAQYVFGSLIALFILGLVGHMAYQDALLEEQAAERWEEAIKQAQEEERKRLAMEEMRHASTF